jgi:hypothetical protein
MSKVKQKKEEISAIASVFGSAETTKVKGKKKKSDDRETVALPKPFDLIVAGSILQNALRKLRAKKEEAKFKAKIFNIFFQKWTKDGDISPSIVGECDRTTALFTLRKMSSISEDTANLLKKNRVPYQENEIVLEGYVLNPDIMFDQKLLGKLAVAVSKLKEFKGVDLFLPQDAIKTYMVTEETYKRAAKIKNIKEREKVLKALTSLSLGHPKIDGDGAGSEKAQKHALELLTQKGVFSIRDDDDSDDDDEI